MHSFILTNTARNDNKNKTRTQKEIQKKFVGDHDKMRIKKKEFWTEKR